MTLKGVYIARPMAFESWRVRRMLKLKWKHHIANIGLFGEKTHSWLRWSSCVKTISHYWYWFCWEKWKNHLVFNLQEMNRVWDFWWSKIGNGWQNSMKTSSLQHAVIDKAGIINIHPLPSKETSLTNVNKGRRHVYWLWRSRRHRLLPRVASRMHRKG